MNTVSYKDIIPLHKALWWEKAELEIQDPAEGNWGFRVNEDPAEVANRVQSLGVSDILHEFNRNSIDLLKMDIEGAEPEALDGMRGLLARTSALDLLFEFNPSRLGGRQCDPVDFLRRLLDSGFIRYGRIKDGEICFVSTPAGRKAVQEVLDLCSTTHPDTENLTGKK